MSTEAKDPLERCFLEKGIVARLTPRTGWGLFAETHFAPGDPIFWIDADEQVRSNVVPMNQAFGVYHDRSATVLPGMAVCVTPDHPFWNVNHSCTGNSGFARWGYFEGCSIPFVAYQDIRPGEQITSDYSLMTSPGEGSPEGDAWAMEDCLCGIANCRDLITDFRNLSENLQLAAMLPNVAPVGRVMAHVLEHEPDLVEYLKRTNPSQYRQYSDALRQQYDIATYIQKRRGWR